MKMNPLGRTGIKVSEVCLGTMTFGQQNTEADGHAQMDYALDRGINFFDTAEMYSIPPSAETQGSTERIIGSWFEKRKNRDRVILATKIAGPTFPYIRDGNLKLNKKHIHQAIDDSLARLKTDYVDLYQLHWPERQTNFFGCLGYEHNPSEKDWTPIEETLEALNDLVTAGKVRAIGLSNESAWGAMTYLKMSEVKTLPRVASIQNPYNLLNRAYEVGLAEVSAREDCGLLAYSPLGFGVLSGKYVGGQWPEGARCSLYQDYKRYFKPEAVTATEAYANLARSHGLKPAQMAIAFVNSRNFVTSNIIGATTLEQLTSNIDAANLVLSEEVMAGINEIHQRHPNPAP